MAAAAFSNTAERAPPWRRPPSTSTMALALSAGVPPASSSGIAPPNPNRSGSIVQLRTAPFWTSCTCVQPSGEISSSPGSPYTTRACNEPSAASAPASSGRRARSDTPTTCRPAPAGFASGPRMFMTVPIARSRRTGPTWRMAGCMLGAYMNTMPVSSSTRRIASTGISMRTPSASSTSALPHCDVKERFPCLAMRTPAPAASSAAAVEMLKVEIAPPPVPQVSTSEAGSRTGSASMARRIACAPPATSAAVSPLTRSAMRIAATCACEASPRMMTSKASAVSCMESELPAASRRIARRSGSADTDRLEQPFGEHRAPRDERDEQCQNAHALHVLFHVYPAQGAIREIEDAHQLVVVYQRKADEGARGEVFIVQQWMPLRLRDVGHQQRLATRGDLARHPFADPDPFALGDFRGQPGGRGDIELVGAGHAQHE